MKILMVSIMLMATLSADIYCTQIDDSTKYCWDDNGNDWMVYDEG